MALAKLVKGLPRYAMDCGWWSTEHWAGASLSELGLQSAAVGYCTRNATDGKVPGPFNILARALGLDEKEVKRTASLLVARGRWQVDGKGWVIVNYLEHNPSADEIESDRERRRNGVIRSNHRRWHVEKNVHDPDCPLCQTSDQRNGHNSDQNEGGLLNLEGEGKGGEGMGGVGLMVNKSSPPNSGVAPAAAEEDSTKAEDLHRHTIVTAEVIRLIAEGRLRQQANVHHPLAWVDATKRQLRIEQGPAIARALAQGRSPDELVAEALTKGAVVERRTCCHSVAGQPHVFGCEADRAAQDAALERMGVQG